MGLYRNLEAFNDGFAFAWTHMRATPSVGRLPLLLQCCLAYEDLGSFTHSRAGKNVLRARPGRTDPTWQWGGSRKPPNLSNSPPQRSAPRQLAAGPTLQRRWRQCRQPNGRRGIPEGGEPGEEEGPLIHCACLTVTCTCPSRIEEIILQF